MTQQTILASRPAAMVLALTLVAGLSAPFVMLPPVRAAAIIPAGTTELSAAPVEQVQAVPPNIAMTFDDSGSMASAYLGDDRPFDNKGWGSRWRCAGLINASATVGTIGAHTMNGVYYNPSVTYYPPLNADGTSFPNADATLEAVWNDGVTANRPLNPSGSGSTTDFTNQKDKYGNTTYWQCYSDGGYSGNLGQNGNKYSTTARIAGGGPYYYQLKASALATLQGQVDAYGNPTSAGLTTLYTNGNWEAVAVPTSQYQNWANWWAYYRTRNQMARTAISRAFGSPNLSAKTADGGYGGNFRVAWQNLYTSDTFRLQANTIISALVDAKGCSASNSATSSPSVALQTGTNTTPPPCYRSAFFNWVFSVPATSDTPARAAAIRAGQFFTRGNGNTGVTGDLHDPYWQPPQTGAFNASTNPGNELYCRQNFHMLVTDGYWNEDSNYSTTGYVSPAADVTLPDGVQYSATAAVSSIYWNVRGASQYTPSQGDIAFNFWAANLRPDLYRGGIGAPNPDNIVAPYLPDTTSGLFTGAGNVTFRVGTNTDGTAKNLTIPAEEYFNPNNDPATWPHMVEYMVTLGVSGILNHSTDYDCKTYSASTPNDACALRTAKTTSDGKTGWPAPLNNNPTGIDDTWNGAVNSRGDYFSAGNPQDLVDQLSAILSNIGNRQGGGATGAVNASVATVGALSFNTGSRSDWSGVFQAVTLNLDGTIGSAQWDAGAKLDTTSATSRNIYTVAYNAGSLNSFAFTAANVASLDATESAGLGPASNSGNDTQKNRINYLRGDQTYEADSTFRKRIHQLGAILHSQPVYVSYPSSGYYNTWPVDSPEVGGPSHATVQSYDTFVTDYAKRVGTVYVGANDGMLHAFNAPVPSCTAGVCTYDPSSGTEDWAFVPRAVYANLGNLTSVTNFKFRPTVDATPVTRDVFFSDQKWHTILAGGVGVGGRGVYALDITGNAPPNVATPATAPNKVLWELDSDMPVDSTCVSVVGTAKSGTCSATDLGYTVSQPNIGRLANGKWVALVPNGYFPDCSQPDIPTPDKTSCAAIAAQAPKDASGNPYSALFVLDAETGNVIAELKTPANIALKDSSGNVTSFGLATPVMGDYQGDQVDDVAFAGDLQGNLWRFDLSSSDPSKWTVTLAYQGNDDGVGNQGLQSITTMPRLFPDPATNRFMVVFGTGKYIGAADNGNNAVQAMMGVRDISGTIFTQSDLTRDYLHETTAPATLPNGKTNPNAGATLRCVTGSASDTCDAATASQVNAIPAPATAGGGGWRIDLYTTAGSGGPQNDQGERVVVNPGAIFASNTVVFETLLTGATGSDPCNPSTKGAVMAFNAITGGPAGVSSLGGWPIVGARINNARTSGSLPLVSALGGGQVYLPGLTVAPGNTPLSIDAPIWRRRSWQEINQD